MTTNENNKNNSCFMSSQGDNNGNKIILFQIYWYVNKSDCL